ncbi:Hsp70 family protein [Methylobacter sp.]|uniref:Hsp70 family protein n=1 Tax=Methylobacter sp. TaxID=2051955 RepID=UPI002488697F|nr:Hsp70 family protein [Methylobacter sp.]MDI1279607.1 Hsp70 family protein [Methylobacter sp.]MDI1360325.1 Hsp70 family protein [Methylobacter sp.]
MSDFADQIQPEKVTEDAAVTEAENSTDQRITAEYPQNGTRFSVGIDLGTTHCVLSYADLDNIDDEAFSPQVMAIPQLTSPGSVEEKQQLPSFLYLAHEAELAEDSTSLPWAAKPDYLVGEIARNLGSKTPIRLVSSAKSWLCHAGVDCKAAVLPAEAPDEVKRVSPFLATTAYLQHLRDAWQSLHPHAPLDQQDVVITVPASFDPAARELTVEAARAVGLGQAILLEEPQAALYSWIEKSHGDWRKHAEVGDIILVIDIGGGTTDLSLIAVTEKDGNLELTRVAVGDHILLGGDNMDLALAYTVKAKLEKDGKRLEPWQVQALTHSCRDAKEKIFNNFEVDNIPLVVASRGSSLIAGTLRTELTREEVNRVLVEGFLPQVAVGDRPVSRPRTGLRTAGLPYAQDAAITRHLAAFLAKQQGATDELKDINLPEHASFLHPTAVLFNGGVLKAGVLAERLMDVLNSWLRAEQAPEARLLAGADLDLAVARGAAYYGYVRKGKGVRIKGGTAASYYVGIESAMPAVPGMTPEIQALCIAPFGMEEGTQQELPDDEFGLVIGEPVRFRFFASHTRREDKVGARLDYWTDEELDELHEIEITLSEEGRRSGEVVPVHLCAAVTEVGTLELQAVSQKDHGRWKIEFDVRAGN